MLKLRLIGVRDYSVLEGTSSSAGFVRWRAAAAHLAWNVIIHLPGGLPMGPAKDLDTAKADFKAAWEALKARTTPVQLAAAYRDLNIRDDG